VAHNFIHINLGMASSVADALEQLKTVVMPWANDGSSPERPTRRTALGVEVGKVDPALGGFQWPYDAAKNKRWGYRASYGNTYVSGIAETLFEAQGLVDAFLLQQYGLLVFDPMATPNTWTELGEQPK